MAARPVRPDVPAVRGAATGSAQDRSFSVAQFEHLVASALDMHDIPDSALTFTVGGHTYPPSWPSTPSVRAQDARRRKTGTFSRLRDAFSRKVDPRDASQNVPPDTRRLASSSVPTLSLLQLHNVPTSNSLISLDIDRTYLDSNSNPVTPADSAQFPSISHPSSRSYGGTERDVYIRGAPSLDMSPSERLYSSTRSFLNLKPLAIPKLTKKPSSGLMASDSPLAPSERPNLAPSASSVVNNIGSSRAQSEALRSFFDDSGFEEELQAPNISKKKSKASFRSFFTSSVSDRDHTAVRSVYKHDKALPPTPLSAGSFNSFHNEPSDTDRISQLYTEDDKDSLFYSPPIQQRLPDKDSSLFERADVRTKSEKEFGSNRVATWIVRSTTSTPRKAKHVARNSPPPYPSPTSPLPPTPNFLSVGPPTASPPTVNRAHANDKVGDVSEESIDSLEILSWRMPSLEQQVSKTSTTSSARAHALGRPSRGSIRDRLGLGPRLHLHVPLPAQFLAESTRRSRSQDGLSSRGNMHPLEVPPTLGTHSTSMDIPRLTSPSLVSLRSVATITAGQRVASDEYDCVDRKDALDAGRAFTPEDDPFAPDPLTPITPVHPIFQTQTSKGDKYHSFMPLGNDSSISTGSTETPISAPASLPSWHYRLGSNSNMSSPALTPSSSIRRAPHTPKSTKSSTSVPDSRIRFPPSLVEALNIRHMLPSTPSSQPSARRHLSRVIAKVRKVGNMHDAASASKPNSSDGGDSSFVGHTESRPHSPFPMLFLKPSMSKPVPAVTRESRRSSVASNIWGGKDDLVEDRPLAAQLVKPVKEPLLLRRIHGQVVEPVALSSKDADAFGDATRDAVLDPPRRDILSPTAWLLDSDDYDDDSAGMHEEAVLADKLNAPVHDLSLGDDASGLKPDNIKKSSASASSRQLDMLGGASPSQVLCETESETETEGNVTLMRASQSWPLPPHRTVVVDEESGEGYVVVEPTPEFVLAGSATHTPRHSIHFPKRRSGAMSIESHRSRRSDSCSPNSRKLTSSQTKLITEKLGYLQDDDGDVRVKSPSKPQALPGSAHQLRQRSRSAASLASARSIKTSKTAFYSARSIASRESDRSTFSFAQSRNVRIFSREGSAHSTSSSRSPPSSAGHRVKSSAVLPDSYSKPELGSATAAGLSVSAARNIVPQHEVFSIPERIVLRATGQDDTFQIVVSGWARLLSICEEYGRVGIEASEDEEEYTLVQVSVEELHGSNSELRSVASEGISTIGVSERKTRSKPRHFIRLSLSLHRADHPANKHSHITFCLPLPATLGGIFDILRQTLPSPSMT